MYVIIEVYAQIYDCCSLEPHEDHKGEEGTEDFIPGERGICAGRRRIYYYARANRQYCAMIYLWARAKGHTQHANGYRPIVHPSIGHKLQDVGHRPQATIAVAWITADSIRLIILGYTTLFCGGDPCVVLFWCH